MSSSTPIVILGGSGFIGTRLAIRLTELGRDIRIGDLNPSQKFPDIHRICDVRKASSMGEILTGASCVINLAAEHRDDVRPISRYQETNVQGAKEVCRAATESGIQNLIFTSSVAVYGSHPSPVDESGPFEPFNAYGETKLLAESVYLEWAKQDASRSLVIIRPTVVFGEGNRGNVFNLLNQIASGRFIMVGPGTNRKSMAYVGNVAEVLVHSLTIGPGIHIFNYADGPDMNMNDLVALVQEKLGRQKPSGWGIPLPLALAGGFTFDAVARLTGRTFPISTIRIRKFCENTQFKADKIRALGFNSPFSLNQALANTITTEFGQV